MKIKQGEFDKICEALTTGKAATIILNKPAWREEISDALSLLHELWVAGLASKGGGLK